MASTLAATAGTAQPAFTPEDLDTFYTIILIVGSASISGCLYVLIHNVIIRRRGDTPNLTQTMVMILAIVDLVFMVPRMFGLPNKSHDATCQVQAFSLAFSAFMSFLWNSCMAHSIYCLVVARESEARLMRRLPRYVAITVFPALLAASIEWATDRFGPAIYYCWIRESKWNLLCTYLWVIFAVCYVIAVLFYTHNHITKRVRMHGNIDALQSLTAITRALRLYMILFVFLWIPSAIFRVGGEYMSYNTRYGVGILMQITLSGHGFVTGLFYFIIHVQPLRWCRRSRSNRLYNRSTQLPTSTSARPNMQATRQPLSIFVSTYNMGEGSLSQEELAKWIPPGQDLYVIGVQECLQLNELRQNLRRHIEGRDQLTMRRSRITRYAQFTREIGRTNTTLGYHGYIAITVFVRQRDVDSGAFFMPTTSQQEVKRGKSLLFGQRASNKGAVGFAFRYFDTSFAVVTCHLTSDLKGKSHVQRRNIDAADVLQSLQLNVDDLGFEFPLMHHHTFVMGDLNYRLTQRGASPQEILELVASARQRDASTMDSSGASLRSSISVLTRRKLRAWLPSPFSGDSEGRGRPSDLETGKKSLEAPIMLTNDSLEDRLTLDGHVAIGALPATTWEDVLQHDELRFLMDASELFFGFEEPKIAFEPTFRRVKGRGILKRDASVVTAEDLGEFYTTELDGRGQRVPSYTDRILHYSLPDVRSRMHCLTYTSTEEAMCSDHKPVSGFFYVAVDRKVRPLISQEELVGLPRMQDVAGVLLCTLRIECAIIMWLGGTAAELSPSDLDALNVTVAFPLPSEDIFSEQRRLHELAAQMRGGLFAFTDSSEHAPKGNSAIVSYPLFCQFGVTHMTLTRPTDAMHVALKFESEDGASIGQGAFALPHKLLNEDGEDERVSFTVNLAVGGQLTGTLEGFVSLTMTEM
ncbi:hypothetical protein Poli38472_006385 [Pythium oligandrum]|uniref:Inositol polyphosphate-related phosphatase domain-containing protein n=1 Tax=Pythium oligandrum TaxID=41045 RepID=A0A8K1C4R8_PYTOL|nr:hypothetical protein Poli38472_006385 [Pythium oligandrum]|eukprot:TMW56375.1 hypothetical protein Poli38472_006385 [Pythium oligandrum]